VRVGFDHFGEIVRGTGEWELVFDGEGVCGLGAMESLFVAVKRRN
jgi:hypothetical protein